MEANEGSSIFDSRFEEAMESFLGRIRGGEEPSIKEYEERYPELAKKIGDVFPGLLLVEQMRSKGSEQSSALEVRHGSESPLAMASPSAKGDLARATHLGEYRLLGEVGRGGMGVVYEAIQESLGRRVALKVLPYHSLLDERLLERFHREAQAAAKLQHPNIVPVFGFGKESGIHYYAMQFIEGRGLDRVLQEVKRLRGIRNGETTSPVATASSSDDLSSSIALGLLTGCSSTTGTGVRAASGRNQDGPAAGGTPIGVERPPQNSLGSHSDAHPPSFPGTTVQYHRGVAALIQKVAAALGYAHAAGIHHRDIKPSNLLLDTQGTVWVGDFGLAKDQALDDITRPEEIVGTLRYMAPERLHGLSDSRSDVYSLGLTLYELLTLKPAFAENDRNRLLRTVMTAEPPRPRRQVASIPRDLELITLKAIQKDPRERYQTAIELAQDLERYQSGLPVHANPSSIARLSKRLVRRHKVAAPTIALAVICALGYVLWTWHDSQLARGPNSIVLADFDGDKHADLATSNFDSANLSVVLDPGRPGSAVRTYPVKAQPNFVTVADWNQDGFPDLAVANTEAKAKSISILLNQGKGTFQRALTIDLPDTLYSLTSGDFEGDGRTDLVAAGIPDRVLFLKNLGGLVFAKPLPLDAAEWVNFVGAADCNRDGKLDLVTASTGSRSISFLKNEGNGVFAKAVIFPAGAIPMRLAIADLDGDQDFDLASANYMTSDTSVLFNAGDGTFGKPHIYPVGGAISELTAADVNGDARIDLIFAGDKDRVVLLKNTGGGEFSAPISLPVEGGGETAFVLPVDWDSDGDVDLLVSMFRLNTIVILLNQGSGVFKQSGSVAVSPW